MEWQKTDKNPTTKYHLVVEKGEDVVVGACGLRMHNKPELRTDQVWTISRDQMCKVCQVVWIIVYSSVSYAREYIKDCDLNTAMAALDTAKRKDKGATLIKMLDGRIKKLEKESR